MAEQRIAGGPRLSPIPLPSRRVDPLEGASALIDAISDDQDRAYAVRERQADAEARMREKQRALDDDALYIDRAVAAEHWKAELAAGIETLRQKSPAGGADYYTQAQALIARSRDDFMATVGNNDRVRQRLMPTVGVLAARMDADEQVWSIASAARTQAAQTVGAVNAQANGIVTDQGDLFQVYNDARSRGMAMLDGLTTMEVKEKAALRPQFEKRYFDALTDRAIADGREADLIAQLKAGKFNDRIADVGDAIANLERKMQSRAADNLSSFQATARATLDDLRIGATVDPQQLAGMAAQAEAANEIDLARDLRLAVPIAAANAQLINSGPAEIRAAQTALEQADPRWRDKPEAVALHNHLDGMYARARDRVQNDVLGLWSASGNRLSPLDISNPASLRARALDGKKAQQRYGGPLQLLRSDEVEPLRRQFEQGGASDKAAIITNFAQAGADIGKAYLRQILPAKPEYGWLTDLAAMRNVAVGQGAVREALNGFEQLKADGTIVQGENGKKMQAAFDSEVAPALRLADGPTRTAVLQVARGLYAARAVQAGVRDFDAGLWSKAMRDALGGGPDGTGGIGWTRGGVKMLLPRGMSQRDVDWTVARADGPSIVAAAGGNMPMWNGRRLLTGQLKAMRMVWVGDGLYAFQSAEGMAAGASGAPKQPFILDIRKLAIATRNKRVTPAPTAREQWEDGARAAAEGDFWAGITTRRSAPPPPAPPKPAALKDKGSQEARDALSWGSE